ncbi:hypothetical protein NEIELOOT_02293 [Neisseria elongata subsp. glycolytica ATCC 29315]|uniref:Uncharacterized protein n=1 Tax=Neisseria elongata subsp. glycolytica ATCC 29315 TaxID=546263 RepID=D4DT91_NEIEG|nr:hypothetical protein NEIELOOT_02293 [Neisseria elongata subsp. glycolytica ATCC 29315]
MCIFLPKISVCYKKLLRQSFCNDYKNTGTIKRFRYFCLLHFKAFFICFV